MIFRGSVEGVESYIWRRMYDLCEAEEPFFKLFTDGAEQMMVGVDW